MTRRATCVGSVRGCCGRVHRSVAAAEACIARDSERCAAGDRIMAALAREVEAAHG